ncbi:TetR/AcrR family transcriptional regulator [Aliidiomarina sp.]|uniref:TetR/AcrR family transcriptional regulator n=1 Tax=Aliidiomarina sp. TaxID=1872439 RepID=UPI003A4D293A
MVEEHTNKRTRVSTEQRQSEILEAAKQVFAERGYQVADVQTIAERAGVGKGTVYRHFPTKEILFKQALTWQLDILRKRVDEALTNHQQPLVQMKEIMRAYFRFYDEHPETIELFVHERAEFGHEETPLYFARMHEQTEQWIPFFESLRAVVPNCSLTIEQMMQLCGELMHGAVYLCMAVVPRKRVQDRLEQVYRAYIHSLCECPNVNQLLQHYNLQSPSVFCSYGENNP